VRQLKEYLEMGGNGDVSMEFIGIQQPEGQGRPNSQAYRHGAWKGDLIL
jgi:hypothetical protein